MIPTKKEALGQILFCIGCCCGRPDRGKPPVPKDWLKENWKQRKLNRSIQLTISGCLGPCDVTNVTLILTPGEQIWLGNISEQGSYQSLLDWATRCHESGQLEELPEELEEFRLNRFQAGVGSAV